MFRILIHFILILFIYLSSFVCSSALERETALLICMWDAMHSEMIFLLLILRGSNSNKSV